MTLADGGGGPPLPLGYARAVDRAVELRERGVTYPDIAIVMHAYHGVGHRAEWWRQECAKRGVDQRPRQRGGLQGPIYKADAMILAALEEAPLTVLQLHYKLAGNQMNVDKIDRGLKRLVKARRVTHVHDSGRGLERRWKTL